MPDDKLKIIIAMIAVLAIVAIILGITLAPQGQTQSGRPAALQATRPSVRLS